MLSPEKFIALRYQPNKKKLIKEVVLFISLILSLSVHAQDEVNYSVHANIIYHFTKYIDWPASKKTGDFVIGVVGETPLYSELKTAVAGKKAGDQNIVVKKLSLSSASNCQILFISESASNQMKKITAGTKDDSILIVSESKGLAQKGSCINFSIANDKLKLEINKNNIEERGLSIASELLQLGTQVK